MSLLASPANTTQVILSGNAALSGSASPTGIHGLRLIVYAYVDGTPTLCGSATWENLYGPLSYAISAAWSNIVIDVPSAVHNTYFVAYYYAKAWTDTVDTAFSMTNLNCSYTFVPSGQGAAGDVKWIATGE